MRKTTLLGVRYSVLAACLACAGCTEIGDTNQVTESLEAPEMTSTETEGPQLATFGAGCFWCVEAVFQQLNGVESVASGYSGGAVENPSYEQVTTGRTGHAEVIQIAYDSSTITYDELLEVFWKTHDPTTLNQQGADRGSQYRSVVFYHNDHQRELAEKYKRELAKSGAWDQPIVTEISPFKAFYKAEAYHQNYYQSNRQDPYCKYVIDPKMDKFNKVFKDKLKTSQSEAQDEPISP